MGVDARGFPGGLLRLDAAFAYVEAPSSGPLPRAEYLTLAPNIHIGIWHQLLQHYLCGIELDYYDIEWFVLAMNWDHSVVFEIAPK